MRRSIRSFDFQLAEREFGNDPSETILDGIDERVSDRLRDIAVEVISELEDENNIKSYESIDKEC